MATIEIKNEHGHYVVYHNGKFIGSADNMSEVGMLIDECYQEETK